MADWELFRNMNQLQFNQAQLQCEMCKCLLTPPIFLDAKGSNICKTCKLDNNIETIRNVALESCYKTCKTVFPCKYLQNGCQEVLLKKNLHKHQRFCNYGPLKCPKCNKDGWENNITKLIEHCSIEHEMKEILNSQSPIKLELKIYDDNEHEVTNLFTVHGMNKNWLVIKVAQVESDQLQVIVCSPSGEKINCEIFLRIKEGDQEIKVMAKINESWNTLTSVDDSHVTKIYLPGKHKKTIDANANTKTNLIVEQIFNDNKQLKQIQEPDNFRKDLECPICLNFLLEDIFKCPNGHNVCGTCKPLINTCPICRETMNDETHDVRLENLLPQITLNCWNVEHGCLFVSDLKELKKHEMTCTYNQSVSLSC